MYDSFDEQVAIILKSKKTPDQSKYKDPTKKFSIATVHPTNEGALLPIAAGAGAVALGIAAMKKAKEAAERLKKKKERQISIPVSEACWKNYEQYGTKMKGGREVPNCIPVKKKKKKDVSEACWKGYKQIGMKKKGKKQVPNCVPVEEQLLRTPQQKSDSYLRQNYFRGLSPEKRLEVLKTHAAMVKDTKTPIDEQFLKSYRSFIEEGKKSAAWQRSEGKSKAGGLNEKGRKSYERENPGSDLKAPSKKVGNPRRKRFCARMSGMKEKLTSKKTANDPNSRINKSLRAWNC